MGIPSFAISLAHGERGNYDAAARFALWTAASVRDKGLPPDTILNINVPDREEVDLNGFVITHQARRRFMESVIEKQDPRGRSYFWIGGVPLPPDGGCETDVGAVSDGRISVTPLHSDMTNYRSIHSLQDWKKAEGR